MVPEDALRLACRECRVVFPFLPGLFVMDLKDTKRLIEAENIQSIDLKYADLVGNWYHITFPVRRLDHVMQNGIPFDGSSIPGMKSVESGDMVLLPDPATAIIDPFCATPRLRMLSYICDADSGLVIADVSTPSAPLRVGWWDVTTHGNGEVWDCRLRGDRAYLALERAFTSLGYADSDHERKPPTRGQPGP